jgi:hypothetical protein
MRIKMKLVRNFAPRVYRDLIANFLEIGFDGLRFWRVGKSLGLLERREERVAGTNFVGGRELRRGLPESQSRQKQQRENSRRSENIFQHRAQFLSKFSGQIVPFFDQKV